MLILPMRSFFAVLALAAAVFAQTTPKRIPPDEAAKHLINKAPVAYPPLAEQARIQGNVILEISIDESGAASARRLVTGHPMLAPAAIESANRWKYQSFEIDGKPAPVVTLVMVPFGKPGKENDAAAHAEILFQDSFWTAQEAAQAPMEKPDYTAAEQQLNRARDVLGLVNDPRLHAPERWQWMLSMGRLAMMQQKYDEAEQYYKKALELRQSGDKDAPEMAVTLAELGKLHAERKRFDLARDEAARSLAIYQKNFKKVASGPSGARQVYGRAIAYQAWMLSRIAVQQNDLNEAGKQCHTLLDFQSFLNAADHNSFVPGQELLIEGLNLEGVTPANL